MFDPHHSSDTEFVNSPIAEFVAEAAGFGPAERNLGIGRNGVTVDIKASGLESRSDIDRMLRIVRPYGSAEPEFRGIGLCNRVFRIRERKHRQHRTELLLDHETRIFPKPGHDRRTQEIS